jgi:hypothetical protein
MPIIYVLRKVKLFETGDHEGPSREGIVMPPWRQQMANARNCRRIRDGGEWVAFTQRLKSPVLLGTGQSTSLGVGTAASFIPAEARHSG